MKTRGRRGKKQIRKGRVWVLLNAPWMTTPSGPPPPMGMYSDEELHEMIDNGDYRPISSASDLHAIRDTSERTWGYGTQFQTSGRAGGLDKKYVLTKGIGIDLEEFLEGGQFYNDGAGWEPLGVYPVTPFTGILDGNGFGVNIIVINRPANDHQGLIAYAENAEIKNMAIRGQVDGRDKIGILVGRVKNTDVTGCFSQGYSIGRNQVGGGIGMAEDLSTTWFHQNDAEVLSSGDSSGGCVGWNYTGSIMVRCRNSGTITGHYRTGGVCGDNRQDSFMFECTNIGEVYGTIYVGGVAGNNCVDTAIDQCRNFGAVHGTGEIIGGIVGWNDIGAQLENSHNRAFVEGGDKVGGAVGSNDEETAVIFHCYSTGVVDGVNDVGGLVGFSVLGATTINSYWDTETSGKATSPGGGTGLTTNQMTYPYDAAAYDGWDFESTWEEDTEGLNDGYPILQFSAHLW